MKANKIKNNSQMKFNTKMTLRKMWSYFEGSKGMVALVIVLSIFSAIFQGCCIYISGYIYEHYLMVSPETIPLTAFSITCLTLLVMNILYSLSDYLIGLIVSRVVEYRVCNRMREDVFNKLQNLPVYYFDLNASGEIITKTSNDVDNISLTFAMYISKDLAWFFFIIVTIILMFMLNWALSLITIFIYPIMIFVTSKALKFIRPYFKKQQDEISKINAFIEERISGNKIVSLYEMQDLNIEEFKKINENLTKNSTVANGFSNAMHPINILFSNLAFVILVGVGITLTSLGYIHTDWGVLGSYSIPGLLIIFTIFARNLSNPINQLITSFGSIVLMMVSAKRIFDVLDQKEEIEIPQAKSVKEIKGYIEAKNLNFGYNKDKLVLKDINFKCSPGTVTALVGPTGCGKTTMVSLLSRFYDVTKGKLLIDNIPIEEITRDSLRENITIVLQDTFLFNTTVRENIRYGKLDASDEDIEAAAKFAKADQFINNMPNGYETIITDNGSNLSQGQRQSIVIARAFLRESKILILDEATSSIDTKTENDIQNSLNLLMQNKTSVIIAHRLSTIRNADNILVMDKGQIIESGTHDQLLAQNGFYAKLYNAQFKNHEEI